MPRTAVATMQTAWDCRWSRPGYRVCGVPDHLQRETQWVCLRSGERRCIEIEECEECPHWEADELRPVQ